MSERLERRYGRGELAGRRRTYHGRGEARRRIAVGRAAFAVVALCTAAACGRPVEPPPPEVIALAPREGPVSIVLVGDVLLAAEGEPLLRERGYDAAFEHVRSRVADADVLVGNLEGPITDERTPRDRSRTFYYKMPRVAGEAIARAGFRALSLANNHALDYGETGMRDTLATVRELGMHPFGAGGDEATARRGVVYDLGSVRIGLLAYSASWRRMVTDGWYADGARGGVALLDVPFGRSLADDLARMRRHADVVIVNVHWGRNYRDVTAAQRRAGRFAIQHGADIVIGHHPHIAQGVELHDGKPIVYSLGNFAFTTLGRFDEFGQPGYGLVARLQIEQRRLRWLALTPIAVDNKQVSYQARPVAPAEAVAALWPRLARFGTAARWRGDTALIGFEPGWWVAPLPRLPWQQ